MKKEAPIEEPCIPGHGASESGQVDVWTASPGHGRPSC